MSEPDPPRLKMLVVLERRRQPDTTRQSPSARGVVLLDKRAADGWKRMDWGLKGVRCQRRNGLLRWRKKGGRPSDGEQPFEGRSTSVLSSGTSRPARRGRSRWLAARRLVSRSNVRGLARKERLRFRLERHQSVQGATNDHVPFRELPPDSRDGRFGLTGSSCQ